MPNKGLQERLENCKTPLIVPAPRAGGGGDAARAASRRRLAERTASDCRDQAGAARAASAARGAKRDYERHELDSRFLRRSGSGGRVRLRRRSAPRRRRSRSRSSSKAQPASIPRPSSPTSPGRTRPPSSAASTTSRRPGSIPRSAPGSSTARSSCRSARGAQIINRVVFEGNRNIQKDQLEVEVQSKPRTAYNEATAEGDIGRIKDAYKKYGRNEASVTKRLVQLPERPRRPRLHHRRRRQDRHSRDSLRRQQRGLELPSAQPDADEHDESSCPGSRAPTSTIPIGSPPTRKRSAATT